MMFWSSFLVGLLGSLHCIGMCGAIALSLPMTTAQKWENLKLALLYNSGRLTTYAVLGLLFGWIGKGFVLIGLQKILALVLGISLLYVVLLGKNWESKLATFPFFSFIKKQMSIQLRQNAKTSSVVIGLLNGFIPCGLVYVAISGSLLSGNPLNGGLYMLSFGLGTLPLMLSLNWFTDSLNFRWKSKLRKATPYVIAFMAIVLIWRAWQIDIQAAMNGVSPAVLECH